MFCVGDTCRNLVRVVRYIYKRHAGLLGYALNGLGNKCFSGHVESVQRFVKNEQRSILEQSACYQYESLFTRR